jgi:pyruvate carboxylase subunit B
MHLYDVTVDGNQIRVGIDPGGGVTVDGNPMPIDLRQMSEHRYSVLLHRESLTLLVEKDERSYTVMANGVRHEVEVLSERDRMLKDYGTRSGSTTSRLEIHAPMPALIVKVEVEVGERVDRGTGLLVLEAMKMENEVKAHQTARVKEIYVTAGKPVEKGELLMLLEEEGEATNTSTAGAE